MNLQEHSNGITKQDFQQNVSSTSNSFSRFDLETKIMNCWQLCDDINTLYKQFDLRDMSQDEIQNALLGIYTIGQLKFEQLFAAFETGIEEGKIK